MRTETRQQRETSSSSPLRVPNIVHQTWKDEKIPEKWVSSSEAWKALHPDWTYYLWTDKNLRDLIVNHYPWFLETYDSYQYTIQRVDAGRCFVLHRYGGWYCDLDIQPTRPFDDLIPAGVARGVFLAPSSNKPKVLTNALMASVAGAPFWEKVFDELMHRAQVWKNGAEFLKGLTVMKSTGPLMITDVAKWNPGLVSKLTKRVFSCGACDHKPCQHPHTYTRILKGDSWHNTACTAAMAFHCSWKTLLFVGLIVVLLSMAFKRGYRINLVPSV